MRGRSLEELDEIFSAKYPVKASRKKIKVIKDAEGNETIKEYYSI
jgi:hypothetical protein